ncbi:sulfite exporter TauE/SafE family protein [Cysteiniphilum halobium]|uniref:sulfite exporter TauE/SafE family protein n=1 Tax=Cysteiniphilum halobium TaxID=2219059 RepID=UPI000E653AEE|nr:TSUP family transporter [Cysteiniphilum halobium]
MEHISFLSGAFVFVMIFFAGFVDCVAGGGGMITIPTYLSVGVPPHLVLGTNKMVMSMGTFSAVIRLLCSVRVYWRTIILGIFLAFIGSLLGAKLISHLVSYQLMTTLLLIIIPTILIIGAFKNYQAQSNYTLTVKFYLRLSLVCFIVGAYDGFFGPGTGTFLFLGFMYILSMSAKESVTNAKIVNLSANFGALIYFLWAGNIDWYIVMIALPAAMMGYLLGAQFVLKANVRWLKKIVMLVLLGLMLKLLFF